MIPDASVIATAHALTPSETAKALATDIEHGLSHDEARRRLVEYGPNELPPEKKPNVLLLFLKQFHSSLAYILIAAALISVLAGHGTDAIGIGIAMLLKAVIGFIQERRAEGALDRLRSMVVQESTVIREGRVTRLPAREVVPGDLMTFTEGDRVTADVRIVECRGFSADESALTGESAHVSKKPDAVDAGALLPDRVGMAWMGTSVVTGEGRALVVETGKRTAFGKIASSLVSIRRGRTPLELRLDRLGRQLGIAAVVLSVGVLVAGTLKGNDAFDMFFFAVALMVSIVPEGLPAVLAVVLAIGVQRMAKRNAIIRHVPSVETLGITDVICTDKTGTLTENKMTVREIAIGGHRVSVTGEGWDPNGGEFRVGDRAVRTSEVPSLELLLRAAGLCNKAMLQWKEGRAAIVGDPTEGALTVMAAKAGMQKADLSAAYPLIDEVPFSSERKFRAVLCEHQDVAGKVTRSLFVVGAYGIVRDRSSSAAMDGETRPFDADARAKYDDANHDMAGRALRVLGVAYKPMPAGTAALSPDDVTGLTFLGAVAMIDPPRTGVGAAIARCRQAGVRVVMVTGDQRATAEAIGREIGLIAPGETLEGRVHTEKDVAAMDDAQFAASIKDAVVFARVTPDTKLRIVRGLQAQGHVVAMTGDGVNDAPALKQASIGVAMGISGTDVTKEVADMVLADDNFVSIVGAIEEGRIVFRNVKQTTAYLFMTNGGEILTIIASLAVGLPLPLLPAQILWMNLVTDGFPDVALATEPPSGNELAEPPRRKDAPIISRSVLVLAAISCTVMALGTIALFAWSLGHGTERHARSVAFTAMAVFQIWNVFNMRSLTSSLTTIGFFTNKYVIMAVIAAFGLQFAVLYQPHLQNIFETEPLSLREWVSVIVVTSSIIVVVEAYKSMCRKGLIPKSWL